MNFTYIYRDIYIYILYKHIYIYMQIYVYVYTYTVELWYIRIGSSACDFLA